MKTFYLDHFFRQNLGLSVTVDTKEVWNITCYRGRAQGPRPSPLAVRVADQLREFLNGHRRAFSLPLRPQGTDFQKKVWAGLQTISYGQTLSYGQLAQRLGLDNSHRAVGNACGKNPHLVVVPCHRVLLAGGGLGGFREGVWLKKKLLSVEGGPHEWGPEGGSGRRRCRGDRG